MNYKEFRQKTANMLELRKNLKDIERYNKEPLQTIDEKNYIISSCQNAFEEKLKTMTVRRFHLLHSCFRLLALIAYISLYILSSYINIPQIHKGLVIMSCLFLSIMCVWAIICFFTSLRFPSQQIEGFDTYGCGCTCGLAFLFLTIGISIIGKKTLSWGEIVPIIALVSIIIIDIITFTFILSAKKITKRLRRRRKFRRQFYEAKNEDQKRSEELYQFAKQQYDEELRMRKSLLARETEIQIEWGYCSDFYTLWSQWAETAKIVCDDYFAGMNTDQIIEHMAGSTLFQAEQKLPDEYITQAYNLCHKVCVSRRESRREAQSIANDIINML